MCLCQNWVDTLCWNSGRDIPNGTKILVSIIIADIPGLYHPRHKPNSTFPYPSFPKAANTKPPTLSFTQALIALTGSLDVCGDTVGSVWAGADLYWLPASSTSVSITDLVVWNAGVADLGSITVVGIDASKHTTILGTDVVHYHMPCLAIVAAVSARSVELAKCVDVQVLNGNGTKSIELEDLIGCRLGTTAVDVACFRALLEDCGT